MSLSGLDDSAVVQAYQTALAEAGGWFLLKYVNRDTVCVLDTGKAGVGEARVAVGKYEEKSPLFGLVQYRRKKIILKYVPEGTSRLLQVRLAVQFQSVLDAFVPHHSVFSFTSADELSESNLALSTMKSQDAISVTSSTSSHRQPRLNEITETAEDVVNTPLISVPATETSPALPEKIRLEEIPPLPASTLRAKALLQERRLQQSREELATVASTNTVERTVELLPKPQTHSFYDGPVSPLTNFGEDRNEYMPPMPSDATRAIPNDLVSRPSFDNSVHEMSSDSDDDLRRPTPKQFPVVTYSTHLSAAESNNISRWTDDVVASTKQKRAPRPHVETNVRPKTSGTSESASPSQPIANLPLSVRVSSRVLGQPPRPGSQQSTRSVPAKFMPSPSATLYSPLSTTMPTFPEAPSGRQYSRPPTSQTVHNTNIGPTVTAEKMRLMKALQMRKRNQFLSQQTAAKSASMDSFQSNTSESLAAQPSSPSSSPTNGTATQPKDDLGSIDESETTSPASVLTVSDHQSTKPSSLSMSSTRKRSQTSISSNTNSSTTPKADSDSKDLLVAPSQTILADRESIMISVASISEMVKSPTEISRDPVAETLLKLELANVEQENKSQSKTDEPEQPKVAGISERSLVPQLTVKKRQAFGGSIRIPPSSEVSEVSDDESLMEEYQDATVHEAKPVSVNRTPATPVLARTPTKETYSLSTRATTPISTSNESQASTPDRRRTASRAGSTRSISTALPQWPPPQLEPVPTLPKQKPTLGSNISKRIKALEGLSQRDSSNNSVIHKDSTTRSGTPTLLKRSSFLVQPSGPSMIPEGPLPRAVTSPLRVEPEEPEEMANLRPLVQRPGTSTEVYTPAHKGETVSVTARIIRDPVKPKPMHETTDMTKGMHRSPLIVEYDTTNGGDGRPSLPRGLTTMSADSITNAGSIERRRFSLSSHISAIRPASSGGLKAHSLSITSPRKRSSKSASETSSVAEDKKSSRTSRMLKRLSGLSKIRTSKGSQSSPSRDVVSPQPNTIDEQEGDPDSMRHVVDIGEVNVQFPETMLWKRRFLRVDDQGYLIFASFSNDQSTEGRSRKIHLEEFRKPCLPDLEHEEMAWSIQLCLKDGRCVQCACESRGAQKATLKLLTDAHWAYHQLYHQ